MTIVSVIRASGVAGLALILSACALFAPPYDATLDQKTTAAYESVAKLAAQAEMGLYQDKATYPGAVDTYATIQGALAVVAVRAASAPVAGRRAEDARGATVGFIKGCSAQVSGLATLHRTYGLVPGTGATTAMMISCDQAAKAVGAMKN
ncbi:hypothetical protein [Caulobacter sp. UNC279MFTsu5.1]|uniref:hypothetical protein n=1 Tax=Caulobacter sp. UNC279MFTsu5.1 TaxID=1502775 RepID=UPI0008E56FBE|nr:hypothetical protein [Caulobacter sp. UNC279MFTsu5.1]SFJ41660.1 hypothetical protein SAMN02799626_01730 [Caulobacter sp. UNC279MFTsu5.1]